MMTMRLAKVCFHVPKFGVWTIAFLAWTIVASIPHRVHAADTLKVFPDVIDVRADYPAKWFAVTEDAQGRWTDVTDHVSLKTSIHDGQVASLGSDGYLHAVAPGQTKLVIEWSGQVVERPIRIASSHLSTPTFGSEVSAVLSKSGCNLGTCHGNLHGKGGFRVSLRGDDPWVDFYAIRHEANGRRVDRVEARESLLLSKPSARVAHQGGLRLPVDSVGYEWIRRWIEGGAKWSDENPSPASMPDQELNEQQVDRLEVYPETAWIDSKARDQNLVVIAVWKDGTRRDVTPWARLEPSAVSGVTIDDRGRVATSGPVDLSIAISYLQARSASRMVFLGSSSIDAGSSMSVSRQDRSNRIDELVESRLSRMGLEPEPLVDDATWMRRSSLVSIGRLPTSNEVRAWITEEDPLRREKWVDRLLADPGYDWMWALHWSDVLRNEPKVMSLKGTELWNEWLRRQYSEDRPIDAIVREMVSTVGSTFDHPPASFHRTHRDPMTAAESIGQVFLGVRMQCARCHNHPFDRWKQDDYYGLAAYFTTIEREQIDNKRPDDLDKHVITGDEIISLGDKTPQILHPGRSKQVAPSPLRAFGLEQAKLVSAEGTTSAQSLDQVARWLTTENRQFARNMANRIWYHWMGRGIVDPPDDFRDSNPPSNPELLEYLTDELIASQYSSRHLARLILQSKTFSRGGLTSESPMDRLPGVPVFAGYAVRRVPAEFMLDALSDVTGSRVRTRRPRKNEEENQATAVPMRAVAAAPSPRNDAFLRAFGKPERLLVCECERSNESSLIQSLMMINGEEVRDRIDSSSSRIQSLLSRSLDPPEILEELYLAALTRMPSEEEKRVLLEHVAKSSDKKSAWDDIVWSLLNSKEFGLIR